MFNLRTQTISISKKSSFNSSLKYNNLKLKPLWKNILNYIQISISMLINWNSVEYQCQSSKFATF